MNDRGRNFLNTRIVSAKRALMHHVESTSSLYSSRRRLHVLTQNFKLIHDLPRYCHLCKFVSSRESGSSKGRLTRVAIHQ